MKKRLVMTLLAIVKPYRDQKGKIQFKATSPGLKEASIELDVFVKTNEQSQACLGSATARKRN